MNKKLNLALSIAFLVSAFTGCQNEATTTSAANEAKPNVTLPATAPSDVAVGPMREMLAVTSFLERVRKEGAPVQVRPGMMDGAVEFPAVLVFGKNGCFAGSFTTMSTLSGDCKNPRSVLSEVPQALRGKVDPKVGGVVLVWVETENNCEACATYRAASMAFANTKHPAKNFAEYKLKVK